MIEVDLGKVVTDDYEELSGKPKINGVELSGDKTFEELGFEGTKDYEVLENKPCIEGVELSGNKTLEELGIASKEELDKTVFKVDTIIEKADLGIKETAIGEEIHLTDSADGKAVEYALYGKATQQTTSGKNLLKYPYYDGTKDLAGIKCTVNHDNSVTFSGTNTNSGTMGYNFANNDKTIAELKNKNIKVSMVGDFSDSFYGVFIICDKDNNTVHRTNFRTSSDVEVKVSDDAECYHLQIYMVSGATVNTTIYPMIRLASITDDTYEPYTGGIPSPNPDYPQEIEVAGSSGSVEVKSENEDGTRSKTTTISTPNGIAGIKVDSGGNYTDQNGQQWICDEVVKYADGSGEYIQRVNKKIVDGVNITSSYVVLRTNGIYQINLGSPQQWKNDGATYIKPYYVICDKFKAFDYTNENNLVPYGCRVATDTCLVGYLPTEEGVTNVTQANAWLQENPVTVYYILATPIRTPLTAQQLADIETFYPVTNITNDFDCGMKVKYKCDGKNYIDKRLALIEQALINNI